MKAWRQIDCEPKYKVREAGAKLARDKSDPAKAAAWENALAAAKPRKLPC